MKLKYCILIVIIFAIIWRSCMSFVNNRDEKKVKKGFYSGVITNIYQVPTRHNNYFFDIHAECGVSGVTASWWWHSWEFAEVGDSIIKPPDTLMIIIKKPNGESREFYYRSESPR